jgi:hypothetical protein
MRAPGHGIAMCLTSQSDVPRAASVPILDIHASATYSLNIAKNDTSNLTQHGPSGGVIMRAGFLAMLVFGLVLTLVSADSRAQSAAACTFEVSPTTFNFELKGGSAEIRVAGEAPTCTFNARSAYPWITVSVTQERGEGVVTATVSGNTSMTHRVGSILIDGKEVSIIQYGPRISGGG